MKHWIVAFMLLMLAQPGLAAEAKPLTAHIATHGKTIDLTLELASTEADREHGLMNRTHLQPYDGMAFFFPEARPEKFWMKNTLIPLDILFVDEAGSIVYIATGTPHSEEPVGPTGPVATVIELAGGRATKNGIAVGDKVTYDIDSRPSALAH